MHTQRILVTPEQAREWLERNGHNRPLNRRHVTSLAREMREGNWRLTHQGVAFDQQGLLLDGQHRLSAVVESGVSVDMMVSGGCERETFVHLDCGRKRTHADVVHMRGHENATAVAATARSALVCITGTNTFPTRGAVDRFVEAHHEILQRFVPIMKTYNAPVAGAFTNAHLAGFQGVTEAGERLMALSFVDDMDPMRVLAKRLRELKGRNVQTQKYHLAIAALKAVHEGRGLKILRESRDDLNVDHSQILLGVV